MAPEVHAAFDVVSVASTLVPAALDVTAGWVVRAAVRLSIDGALLAVPVWLLCRLAPGLPATARTWLWWCVSLKMLLGAFAVPGLGMAVLPASWSSVLPASHQRAALTLGVPLAFPLGFPAAGAAPVTRAPVTREPLTRDTLARKTGALETGASDASAPVATPLPNRLAPTWTSRGWLSGPSGSHHTVSAVGRLVAVVWLGGLLLHVALLIRHGRRLRDIVARAGDPSPELLTEHEAMARRLGLDRTPRLLESREVDVPQVVGARRPIVLVPAGTGTRLSSRERAMVLGHELMHVQRHDLALAWVPVAAERLMVWHPLAWLAAREYALAREAACDHAVLDVLDVDAVDYGRLLVRLGVGRPIPGTVAAGASPSFRLLRRRLTMLHHTSSHSSLTTRVWSLAAAVIVSVLPFRVVAQSQDFPGGIALYDVVASNGPMLAASAQEAAQPREAQPREAQPRKQATTERRGREGDASGLASWVYLIDDDQSMNGGWSDLEAARAVRRDAGSPLFVFRHDGRRYAITDAKTLQEVDAILEPMRELGRQQGELGERQGRLGEAQGRLGEKQGALGERQGQLGAKQAELSGQLVAKQADALEAAARQMRAGAPNDETRRLEREVQARAADVERQMEALGAQQSALGDEQAVLGREQAKLGEQQGTLGDEQGRLGELQGRAARKADGELRALAERAIAQGLARDVSK